MKYTTVTLVIFEYLGQRFSWSTFILIEGSMKNVVFSEKKKNEVSIAGSF